jgi:hypothetical protein
MTALAVVSHFSLTLASGAWLSWMTKHLAPVRAIITRLHASLATAFLHKLLNCFEALSSWVANLLADVSTSERDTALLATVWWSGMAVHLREGLLATETGLRDRLEARWAVA